MSIPIISWVLIILTCYEVTHGSLAQDHKLFSFGWYMLNGVMRSDTDGADGAWCPPVTKTLYPLVWPCCLGFQPPECGLKWILNDQLETWIWTFDCPTKKYQLSQVTLKGANAPFINFPLKSNLGSILVIIWQNIKVCMYKLWKEKLYEEN